MREVTSAVWLQGLDTSYLREQVEKLFSDFLVFFIVLSAFYRQKPQSENKLFLSKPVAMNYVVWYPIRPWVSR